VSNIDRSPVFDLDSDLNPVGVTIPCPSTFMAVLGFKEPTEIPCCLIEGHKGPHRFEAKWSDPKEAPSE